MKKLLVLMAIVLLAGCGRIHSGNVGVRTSFNGTVEPETVTGFYTSVTSHVDEWTTKETDIDLKHMTPKARDNLSLKDMDVSIYYRTDPTKIPGIAIKYTGQSAVENGMVYPGYNLIANIARNAIYEEVAKSDSLTIHTQREQMAASIKAEVQKSVNATDPDTFTITRVLIRQVVTDPTIEASIQQAVASQKNLDNKRVQVDIAKQDAAIRVAEAKGIAEAQGIINSTLTREYLQHESNEVLKRFAEKGGTTTVLMPYGTGAAPLISVAK